MPRHRSSEQTEDSEGLVAIVGFLGCDDDFFLSESVQIFLQSSAERVIDIGPPVREHFDSLVHITWLPLLT